WSDQAVLARTNAQLAAVERALRRAGVPTAVRGGARLVDRAEVRAVLARLAHERTPVGTVLADLSAELDDQADDEVRAALGELVVLGREYLALTGDPQAPPSAFAAWVRALSPSETPGGRTPGVELATFHAAKGLEWRVVHVIGVEAGFVPIGHARRPEQIDEERRLLYVALSRASHELVISWAANRRFGDKVVERRRSPLLGSLDPRRPGRRSSRPPSGGASEPEPVTPLAGLALARASLGTEPTPAPAPDPILEALVRWRDARARAVEAPPATVLSDEVLRAIAQRRPRTAEDVATVPGVGPSRAARYATEIVDVVAGAGD
ncbi:MAG: ATP-dependent DNA helicase UvrD2, partial [Acidimicrobiales bacterium]|nr:ATP-dependent DNA helicase UvrD2 [Acidimicrobiales bacterium]